MGMEQSPRKASGTPSDYPPKLKTKEEPFSYREAQQLALDYVIKHDLFAQTRIALKAAEDSYKEAQDILREAARFSKFSKQGSIPYTHNGRFVQNNPYEQEIERLKRTELAVENLIAGRIPRPNVLTAGSVLTAGLDTIIGAIPVQKPFPPAKEKRRAKGKQSREEKDALYKERLQSFFDSVKNEVRYHDPLIFVVDNNRKVHLRPNSEYNVFKIEEGGREYFMDTSNEEVSPEYAPSAQQFKALLIEEKKIRKQQKKAKKKGKVIDLDAPAHPNERAPLQRKVIEQAYDAEEQAPAAVVEEAPVYEEVTPVQEEERTYEPIEAADVNEFFEQVIAADPIPFAEAQELLESETTDYIIGKTTTPDRLQQAIILYARSLYPEGRLSSVHIQEIQYAIAELFDQRESFRTDYQAAGKIKERKIPKEPSQKEIERNIARFETGKGRIPAWRSIVFLLSALTAVGAGVQKGVTDPESVRRGIAYVQAAADQLINPDEPIERTPDPSSGTQDTLPADPKLEEIMEDMSEPFADIIASNDDRASDGENQAGAR